MPHARVKPEGHQLTSLKGSVISCAPSGVAQVASLMVFYFCGLSTLGHRQGLVALPFGVSYLGGDLFKLTSWGSPFGVCVVTIWCPLLKGRFIPVHHINPSAWASWKYGLSISFRLCRIWSAMGSHVG